MEKTVITLDSLLNKDGWVIKETCKEFYVLSKEENLRLLWDIEEKRVITEYSYAKKEKN